MTLNKEGVGWFSGLSDLLLSQPNSEQNESVSSSYAPKGSYAQ